MLKISRNIGSTNLIVLDSTDKNKFSINEDLGGAYLEIVFNGIDEVVREIIFQILTTENFSFSDSKTHSLVKMAKK